MQGVAQPQCSLPFPLAFLPESKTGYSAAGLLARSSRWRLPGSVPVALCQDLGSELTAAGTAPDLHRIPF